MKNFNFIAIAGLAIGISLLALYILKPKYNEGFYSARAPTTIIMRDYPIQHPILAPPIIVRPPSLIPRIRLFPHCNPYPRLNPYPLDCNPYPYPNPYPNPYPHLHHHNHCFPY